MLSGYFDAYATKHQPYKGGAWCYEDGLVYRGLELLHKASGEDRWLDHMIRLIEPQISGPSGLAGFRPTDYNIDNVKSGRALLYLFEATKDARYLDATQPLINQLKTHPRTHSGVYWHKLAYPWQIWLDGLYMGAPFRVGLARIQGDDDAIDDVIQQILTALDKTYDAQSGLYAHAFDESRMQSWSCATTGQSPAIWGRAIGWLAMCLVDLAELLPPQKFAPLLKPTQDLLDTVERYRATNGLWFQVMDQPDLVGNYEEASASAMFTYALLAADRLGLRRNSDDGLLDVLIADTVRTRPDGQQEMFGMCGVAGLGGFEGNYRDGTPAYYLSESIVSDDPKGVGPLMGCCAQAGLESKTHTA